MARRLRRFVLLAIGAMTPGMISGGGAAYSPSLDFSDARNSQYLGVF